jgi:hypothetical protein
MAERGKRRAMSPGLESEPPMSATVATRPRTALGLGPAKEEALAMAEPIEVEPVPEDFAERLGATDNDAPLPRETAVLNLDMVFRASSDDDASQPSQPRRSDLLAEDEDDPFDDELPEGERLAEDDMPDSEDFIALEVQSKPRPTSAESRVITPVPWHAGLWPLLIVVAGLLVGYILASALLSSCQG